MKIDCIPFLPADGVIISGDRTKAEESNFNQSAGPAFTLMLDGEMVAAGGVRRCVGEAWFVLSEGMRARLAHQNYQEEKKVIIETCKAKLDDMCRTESLYRLYAEARIAERFCEALGFVKKDNLYLRG